MAALSKGKKSERPGWQTPAAFAQTFDPVAQPAQMGKTQTRSPAHAG